MYTYIAVMLVILVMLVMCDEGGVGDVGDGVLQAPTQWRCVKLTSPSDSTATSGSRQPQTLTWPSPWPGSRTQRDLSHRYGNQTAPVTLPTVCIPSFHTLPNIDYRAVEVCPCSSWRRRRAAVATITWRFRDSRTSWALGSSPLLSYCWMGLLHCWCAHPASLSLSVLFTVCLPLHCVPTSPLPPSFSPPSRHPSPLPSPPLPSLLPSFFLLPSPLPSPPSYRWAQRGEEWQESLPC